MPDAASRPPPSNGKADAQATGEAGEATPKGLPTSDRYHAETAHVDETHDPRKAGGTAKTRGSQGKGA
jgi:hypothetical protein